MNATTTTAWTRMQNVFDSRSFIVHWSLHFIFSYIRWILYSRLLHAANNTANSISSLLLKHPPALTFLFFSLHRHWFALDLLFAWHNSTSESLVWGYHTTIISLFWIFAIYFADLHLFCVRLKFFMNFWLWQSSKETTQCFHFINSYAHV